ncbi:hypothetical protein NQZ68_009967 [Dissostichus eleginoides]|nr:hypothetical protein NQZ68_009967 [Dissostichus eleginoides]
MLQHEVMVEDEWHNNGPQDLVMQEKPLGHFVLFQRQKSSLTQDLHHLPRGENSQEAGDSFLCLTRLFSLTVLPGNVSSFSQVAFQAGNKLTMVNNSTAREGMLEHNINWQTWDPPKHEKERCKACCLMLSAIVTECQHLEHLWPPGLGMWMQGPYHAPKCCTVRQLHSP